MSVTSAGHATPQWDDVFIPMQSTGETYEGWGVKNEGRVGCGEWDGNSDRWKKFDGMDLWGFGFSCDSGEKGDSDRCLDLVRGDHNSFGIRSRGPKGDE